MDGASPGDLRMARRATLLHVDDDEPLLHLFEEVIKDADPAFEYVTAAGGKDAHAQLEELSPPVLFLLDRKLPDTDLWDFVDSIRDNERFAASPIFILSGTQDPKAIAAAYERGAAGFLPKPSGADGFHDLVGFLESYLETVQLPDR